MSGVEISDELPVLIDLLNSGSATSGTSPSSDSLDGGAAAAAWLRAHGGSGSVKEIADVRRFRTALIGYLRGGHGEDVFGPWTSRIRREPKIVDGVLTWTTTAPPDSAIAARALLEWAELCAGGAPRVRACANPDCGLFFIDRSKANARKWCDMAVCGNRTKARRYYARTTQGLEAAAARARQPADKPFVTPAVRREDKPPAPQSRPRPVRNSPTRITLPNSRISREQQV